jgi:hypothetical protein
MDDTAMIRQRLRGKILRGVVAILAAAALMNGCVHRRVLTINETKDPFLLPVKFQRQEPNECGVAALSSILDYFGIEYSEIEKIYNEEEKGTKLITLVNYSNNYIDTGVKRVGYEEMVESLSRGSPLILMRRVNGRYHYFVVKGFLTTQRTVVVNDGYKENVVLDVQEYGAGGEADIAVLFGERQTTAREDGVNLPQQVIRDADLLSRTGVLISE